jgi:hypothetical protein
VIVHHKSGELVSGLMSRQYRTVFNVGVPVAGGVAGVVAGWLGPDFLFWLTPAAAVGGVYVTNATGRMRRIKPGKLGKITKTHEDEVLELQDIFFRMPSEHQKPIDDLLEGAYEQIRRGNPNGIQPRLQQARFYRDGVLFYVSSADPKEDVQAAVRAETALRRALTAGPSASKQYRDRETT